jgi:hypothetical protein
VGEEPLTKANILDLIADEPVRMALLHAVAKLDLPDCWIGAGFVRNLVWDHLHGFSDATPLNDIDVIFFDAMNVSENLELKIAACLEQSQPQFKWDVKNQARMHTVNGDAPYESSIDALSFWPKTATAIAVRLWDETSNRLELAAPLGVEDLVALRVRPTPAFKRKMKIFEQRIMKKHWQNIWPNLRLQ